MKVKVHTKWRVALFLLPIFAWVLVGAYCLGAHNDQIFKDASVALGLYIAGGAIIWLTETEY